MRDFKFVKRGIAIGGLIATSIFVLASGGSGSTKDRGRTSNGRNTERRPSCRTFAGYYDDVLAGYYELRRDADGGVEIAYFGLLPEFIGRGLGGALANQRDRRSVAAWRDRTHPCLGAYVQPRSSAGARELSGARDDRLQGRGRGLGGDILALREAVSFPYRMRLEKHVRQASGSLGFAPEN